MPKGRDKEYSRKKEATLCKGQAIMYKGKEAKILEVKPVLTIKIEGRSQVVCGNILREEVSLR